MKSLGIPLQYACFKCRKSFKRPQFSASTNRFIPSEQLRGQQQEAAEFEAHREYKCPNCGGPSQFMGQDFKAPKRQNLKAWKEVHAYISSGKIYYRGNK
jgi:DNA-directed RNA polymerase subunit RPC12/RpoP